jgi:hypothetical protein
MVPAAIKRSVWTRTCFDALSFNQKINTTRLAENKMSDYRDLTFWDYLKVPNQKEKLQFRYGIRNTFDGGETSQYKYKVKNFRTVFLMGYFWWFLFFSQVNVVLAPRTVHL